MADDDRAAIMAKAKETLPSLPDDFVHNDFWTAVAATPLEESEVTYYVDLKRDWCIGLVPHGGYLAGLLAHVTKQHMSLRHASFDQSDLISQHIEFTQRTVIGCGKVLITELHLGRQFSALRVQLYQQHSKNSFLCIESLIRQGNLKKEAAAGGITLETRPILSSIEFPDRNSCWEMRDPDWLYAARATYSKLVLLVPYDADGTPNRQRFGPSVREQWVTWRGNRESNVKRGFDISGLAYLADAFIPLPEAYGLIGNWFPTINFNLEVKKGPPKDQEWEWLFMRIESHQIRHGRCDIDVVFFDEDGDLVALSRHVALIVSMERNVKKKGEGKL